MLNHQLPSFLQAWTGPLCSERGHIPACAVRLLPGLVRCGSHMKAPLRVLGVRSGLSTFEHALLAGPAQPSHPATSPPIPSFSHRTPAAGLAPASGPWCLQIPRMHCTPLLPTSPKGSYPTPCNPLVLTLLGCTMISKRADPVYSFFACLSAAYSTREGAS